MSATMAIVVARYGNGAIEITGWGWISLYTLIWFSVWVATGPLKRRGDK